MIRENWRVLLLVLLLVVSAVALFVPGVGLGTGGEEVDEPGLTNLRYGLDLDSGTRIEAPLVGLTATGVDVGDRSPPDIEAAIAAELDGVDAGDVGVRFPSDDPAAAEVEVTANVTDGAFTDALVAADLSYETLRGGVTESTRTETVRVLSDKVDEAGLAGATVQSVYSQGDERWFVRVEVPGQNESEVTDLVNARGEVRVYAYHEPSDGDGYENRTVLTRQDFQEIGFGQTAPDVGPHVPVVIESDDVDGDGEPEHERFERDMRETGIAEAGTNCEEWSPDVAPCLLTVVDGELVYSAGMSPDLGRSMVQQSWVNDPRFVLQTGDLDEARELAIHLRAGALPASLDLDNANFRYVSPSLGERFRVYSLITAIITVFAVAFVVFVRYGEPRVAAPMVVTALSEVAILLGFAAAVGMALDLSHIAGFIAVIGTGVDDLIIIADEVMGEGSVSSDRVFQNRFRKAFWIIGVAAATTIIAMSPLAVLSLGDLRGFAIVTILGVLVGVLVTRPAYGDILHRILTGR